MRKDKMTIKSVLENARAMRTASLSGQKHLSAAYSNNLSPYNQSHLHLQSQYNSQSLVIPQIQKVERNQLKYQGKLQSRTLTNLDQTNNQFKARASQTYIPTNIVGKANRQYECSNNIRYANNQVQSYQQIFTRNLNSNSCNNANQSLHFKGKDNPTNYPFYHLPNKCQPILEAQQSNHSINQVINGQQTNLQDCNNLKQGYFNNFNQRQHLENIKCFKGTNDKRIIKEQNANSLKNLIFQIKRQLSQVDCECLKKLVFIQKQLKRATILRVSMNYDYLQNILSKDNQNN